MTTKASLSPQITRLHRSSSVLAGVAIAWLLTGVTGPVQAEPSASDCVWGQPGYRDCVDKLLEQNRKKEAAAQPGAGSADTKTQVQAQAGTAKKTTRPRRPGAGSLDPIPPAELRLTNPNTNRLDDALMSEQRQRQIDINRQRYDHPVPAPIMPPYYGTPANGRICPSWGC